MRKTALKMVYELAKEDKRVFFIGSDLGEGTLQEFRDEMPDRFFMEGISEANIMGLATGLALEGKIPYVNTIGTFLTRRCFDQLVVDVCLHHANVRLIANGGGLVYAVLGPTHQAIEDIAILRAIPSMTIIVPADSLEMERMMPKTLLHEGPIYIRLAKGEDPIVTQDLPSFKIGSAYTIREGKDAVIFTTGITLKLALEASDELWEKERKRIGICHVPTMKPLDKEKILDWINLVPIIITIEEHSIIGGLGSAVADLIIDDHLTSKKLFKRIGIPDTFPDQYGSQASLMNYYKITSQQIIYEIMRLRSLY